MNKPTANDVARTLAEWANISFEQAKEELAEAELIYPEQFEDEEEDGICPVCDGSGEPMEWNSTAHCWRCGGSGTEPKERIEA